MRWTASYFCFSFSLILSLALYRNNLTHLWIILAFCTLLSPSSFNTPLIVLFLHLQAHSFQYPSITLVLTLAKLFAILRALRAQQIALPSLLNSSHLFHRASPSCNFILSRRMLSRSPPLIFLIYFLTLQLLYAFPILEAALFF